MAINTFVLLDLLSIYSSAVGGHHNVKLFVVDLTVSVNVDIVNQALDLFFVQFLTQVHHHYSQLLPID